VAATSGRAFPRGASERPATFLSLARPEAEALLAAAPGAA
jgi:hypothetical protein